MDSTKLSSIELWTHLGVPDEERKEKHGDEIHAGAFKRILPFRSSERQVPQEYKGCHEEIHEHRIERFETRQDIAAPTRFFADADQEVPKDTQ